MAIILVVGILLLVVLAVWVGALMATDAQRSASREVARNRRLRTEELRAIREERLRLRDERIRLAEERRRRHGEPPPGGGTP